MDRLRSIRDSNLFRVTDVQQVAHFFLLGFEIAAVFIPRRRHNRHSLDHFEAEPL